MVVHQSVGFAAAGPEKRAYARVPVALAGKVFFPPGGTEQDCIVTDISLGGATLQCGGQLAIGTELVLYLEGFGRFAGAVVRTDAQEAGMCFECSDASRMRTAERIVFYLSGVLPQATQLRRGERTAVSLPRRFARANGELAGFELRDISLTGASLKTAVRPLLGEIVMIGAATGRVTRHLDDGFALEFVQVGT